MNEPNRRRSIPSHWTPRYLFDRSQLALRQRAHSGDPWLTRNAVVFLAEWLRGGDTCLEWGSGRSTSWLSRHGVRVFTVEHDPIWAKLLTDSPTSAGVELAVVTPENTTAYAGAHATLAEVDLALVDGIHRDVCALRAVELVKPGGLIVVDNVERYLPSSSRAPESRGDAVPDAGWAQFAKITGSWRRYWTSDGVTDTAIWFKPPS